MLSVDRGDEDLYELIKRFQSFGTQMINILLRSLYWFFPPIKALLTLALSMCRHNASITIKRTPNVFSNANK